MTRRQTWKGGNDTGRGRKEARKSANGDGGRQGRNPAMVVAGGRRGAQRQRTRERHRPKTSMNGVSHGGRLESARDQHVHENASVTAPVREASTVNDAMKQITRDRRGSSPVSKD